MKRREVRGGARRSHKGGHIRLADLLGEALAGILQRPGRAALTAAGTMLGVAVLVGVLGLTSSASAQVSSRFNPAIPPEVSLTDAASAGGDSYTFLPDAEQRVRSLAGVRQAGIAWDVPGDKLPVAILPPPAEPVDQRVSVMGATPGFLDLAEVSLESGRLPTQWEEDHATPVAVVGSQIARSWGIGPASVERHVWVDGVRVQLVGVLASAQRHPEVLTGMVLPSSTARQVFADRSAHAAHKIVATVDHGAAGVVGAQLPVAANPDRAGRYEVTTPPDVTELRGRIGADFGSLFVLLAGICLVIGMVGIANTSVVAVVERTGEIGLRRAVGARRRDILVQFLTESVVLGALGGIVGASLGVLCVVVVCLVQSWTAVLDWRLAVLGPVVGVVSGALAGLYPAHRATTIEPTEALRR